MTLECAFFGFLASDAEVRRTSQAGKRWALLRVGVGKGDDIQWVSVAVFGKAALTWRTAQRFTNNRDNGSNIGVETAANPPYSLPTRDSWRRIA